VVYRKFDERCVRGMGGSNKTVVDDCCKFLSSRATRMFVILGLPRKIQGGRMDLSSSDKRRMQLPRKWSLGPSTWTLFEIFRFLHELHHPYPLSQPHQSLLQSKSCTQDSCNTPLPTDMAGRKTQHETTESPFSVSDRIVLSKHFILFF
jgi:hypothetical protein